MVLPGAAEAFVTPERKIDKFWNGYKFSVHTTRDERRWRERERRKGRAVVVCWKRIDMQRSGGWPVISRRRLRAEEQQQE